MSSTTTNTNTSSSSNPSSTTTPPRRQSCDRCHSQKLRCTRASNGGSSNSPTGVCNRCLRLGAQCIYSPCLPKGRPPAVFRPPPTPAPTPALAPAPTGIENTSNKKNNNNNNSNNAAHHQQLPLPDDLLNLDVDASLVWPTWVPPLETVDWSALNMNMAMDIDGSGSGGRNAPPSPPLLPAAAFMDPVEATTSASSASSEAASYISGPSAVYQLSELITRLYALHRQSSALTEAATAGRALGLPLIINDATFPPVAAWLQHLSANSHTSCAPLTTPPGSLLSTPTGETLHGTFSAAHSLLAVLDRLQAEPAPGAATPSSTTDGLDTTDFWDLNINTPLSSSASSYFDLSMATPPSAAPARPSLLHSSSSTVVRHLVGACHSLLLNVFIGPLDALQHDADLNLAQSQSGQAGQACQATANPASPGPNSISDSSGLAHLRLVMVTHLCSYLIRRLQHAVSLYSSPPLSGSESLSDLDDQIWKRLAQLRATLHI